MIIWTNLWTFCAIFKLGNILRNLSVLSLTCPPAIIQCSSGSQQKVAAVRHTHRSISLLAALLLGSHYVSPALLKLGNQWQMTNYDCDWIVWICLNLKKWQPLCVYKVCYFIFYPGKTFFPGLYFYFESVLVTFLSEYFAFWSANSFIPRQTQNSRENHKFDTHTILYTRLLHILHIHHSFAVRQVAQAWLHTSIGKNTETC